MEKIIGVNGNMLFSDEHFVSTKRGLLKAKELQIGDKIVGVNKIIGANGELTITSIIECKKRPDAPIIR